MEPTGDGLLDVGDVEALDPDRKALEVERLAELFERLDPAQARSLRCAVSCSSASSAFCCASSCRRRFSPRRAGLTSTFVPRSSERNSSSARARPRFGRDDDQRRDARRASVVLEAERLEQRVEILARDVLEKEAVAIGEPPAPERKDLHRRVSSAGGDPDDVDGADRALVGGLALGEVAHGEEAVAHPRSLLEVLPLGRCLHPLLELALDRPRLAGEELDDAVDDLSVVLLRDVVDAGRQAAVDVVVEARDARVAARLRPLTRAEAEDAVEDVEGLAHLLRVRVRAEVDDSATVALAREHDAREVVLHRDRDVRVRLVVAQADVEWRPVPLMKFCSRWKASVSFVTMTSIRSTRSVSLSSPARESPPRKYERTRERSDFAFPT